jgi:DNA-binding NtrC family response regulator
VSPKLKLLQSLTSVADITPLLAGQPWEIRRFASLSELIPTREVSYTVGIVVFDPALACSPNQLLELVNDWGMEWIAVVPPDYVCEAATARALSGGFFDYHTLPVDRLRLLYSVGHAHGKAVLRRSSSRSAESFERRYGMIGQSPNMLTLYAELEKVMRARAPVFISGESGVGKELAARAVHLGSRQRQGPFISVNCGALPETLIESLLFGHEKGSFTGANERRIGSIEAANGGTIFLDEIGDLPRTAQASLLRFLQESTVTRVGSTREIRIDTRIIAATHMDLRAAIKADRFREDLFYRLNVLNVEVPPLRDRDTDCISIAEHCFNARHSDKAVGLRGFTDEALKCLQRHRWPGNVRELLNRVQRAMVMCDGALITAGDLQLTTPSIPTSRRSLANARDGLERSIVEAALARSGWNASAAARDLGVSRVTLYRLRRRLGIVVDNDPRFDDPKMRPRAVTTPESVK